MKIGPVKFRIGDVKWFSDKGKIGNYISDAKNMPEIEHRLKWLGEGSLEYHLTKFQSPFKHGGNQNEKDLYNDFINFLIDKETKKTSSIKLGESSRLKQDNANLGILYEMMEMPQL